MRHPASMSWATIRKASAFTLSHINITSYWFVIPYHILYYTLLYFSPYFYYMIFKNPAEVNVSDVLHPQFYQHENKCSECMQKMYMPCIYGSHWVQLYNRILICYVALNMMDGSFQKAATGYLVISSWQTPECWRNACLCSRLFKTT